MNEDFNHIKACLRQILLTTEPNDPETVLHVMTKYVVQMPEDLRFRAGEQKGKFVELVSGDNFKGRNAR